MELAILNVADSLIYLSTVIENPSNSYNIKADLLPHFSGRKQQVLIISNVKTSSSILKPTAIIGQLMSTCSIQDLIDSSKIKT